MKTPTAKTGEDTNPADDASQKPLDAALPRRQLGGPMGLHARALRLAEAVPLRSEDAPLPSPPKPQPQAPVPPVAKAAPVVQPAPAPAPETQALPVKPAANIAANPAARAAVPPPKELLTTVGKAKLRLRHYVLGLLFVLLVILPPVVWGRYLYTTAVDQYQSDVGFGSRTQEGSNTFDVLNVIGAGGGASTKDMDILNHFIDSQELVERVDAKLDLRKVWSRYPADWYFSFPADGPIEDLVDYWNDMVKVSYDSSSGLMTLKVYAFSPEDAQAIAHEIVVECTAIINEMSKTAQDDTTRYARDTLAKAEGRYRDAQNALADFRIKNHIVDPQTQLAGASQVINSLVQQRAEAQINLDLLVGQVADSDPRIAQLTRRIAVIDKRLDEETGKVGSLGDASDPGYAALIRDYQALTLEMDFAQKAYIAAQGAYDQTMTDAVQQTHYLATFLEPTKAQSTTAPDRPLQIFLTLLAGLLAWTAISMIYYALRDRR